MLYAPIDSPTGPAEARLRYMLGPAASQPIGKLTVTSTAAGAGMRCVVPARTRTPTNVRYGRAVGSRAGGPEADTASGAACAMAVSDAKTPRDEAGVALATGARAVAINSLVRNAKPTNAIAATATAAGPRRRRCVTTLNAPSPTRPSSLGSGGSPGTRFIPFPGGTRRHLVTGLADELAAWLRQL